MFFFCVCHLASELGFVSEAAHKYVRKGSGHNDVYFEGGLSGSVARNAYPICS